MIKKIFILFLVFLVCLVPAFALSVPKQDNSIYVNDYADVLSDSTKDSLISLNKDSDYSTGGYVVVATFDFVEGDIYDYAYQIFNEWKIGDSKNNNGVLLVLDIGNENCSWVIGTGLESILTDSRCQTIIDDYFKKDFLDKKYDDAVMNTTKQFLKYIENGNFQVEDHQQSGFLGMDIWEVVKIGAFIFIVVVAVIAGLFAPRRRGYTPRPRRYHRPPPPPPHYGPGPRPMGGPRPRSRGFGGPRPSSRGPRPSGGSMSRPRTGGSSGGTHHSGGHSRGAGGSLK